MAESWRPAVEADGSDVGTILSMDGTVFTRQEVVFESGGVRCAADLYRPDASADERLPCVVMGHGASGTKRLGLPNYATKFADAGMAVLAFDYRHFGASEGEPRQWIDVASQRADYRAAVRYVRGRTDIDPRRVALWGTSLSGGHVLAVAARDPGIAAVVSQVPVFDGWHRGRTLRQRLTRDVLARTFRFTAAAARDLVRSWRAQSPLLVPVVAESGRVAAFTDPEARATFEALGGEATGWRNALAPRFIFALPRYEKGTAEALTMPVLLCLADHDLEASSAFAAKVAARAPCMQVRLYAGGHFDVYLGPLFGRISDDQVSFLRRHLRATGRRARVAQEGPGSNVSPPGGGVR